MSIPLLKLALDTLSHPTAIAVLGSVGLHAALGIALPTLPLFSAQESEVPRDVDLVELTPAELARIPALSPTAAIPFAAPPSSTQLLPLPQDFQLPSRSASIPQLPPRPNPGTSSFGNPGLSTPDRVVTRSRGLPGRPSGRRGGVASRGLVGTRQGVRTGGNRRREREIENQGREFKVDGNRSPEEGLRASIRRSIEQGQPHKNETEIAVTPENTPQSESQELHERESLENLLVERGEKPGEKDKTLTDSEGIVEDNEQQSSPEDRDRESPEPENRQHRQREEEEEENENEQPRETPRPQPRPENRQNPARLTPQPRPENRETPARPAPQPRPENRETPARPAPQPRPENRETPPPPTPENREAPEPETPQPPAPNTTTPPESQPEEE